MARIVYKAYRIIAAVLLYAVRLAVFLITIAALLGAVVIALTQLDSFRRYAVERGIEALNKSLQGRVEVGSVSGNLITGLQLHDVHLYAAGTELLDAPRIELEYQLRPLLSQKVLGARVRLFNPTIRLIRDARDSTWNFTRITRPTPVSTTTSAPFSWTIDVPQLEVVDGRVIVDDRTTPQKETGSLAVDYSHLDLHRFFLSMEGHIAPLEQNVAIQNLAFDLPASDMRVIEMAGRLGIDSTGLTVDAFDVQTTRSRLTVDGRIDSVNIFNQQKMMTSPAASQLRLALDAQSISMVELQRLVPSMKGFGGAPSARLAVSGTLNDLVVQRLDVELSRSHIAATGRVRDLFTDQPPRFDATVSGGMLTYADKPIYLPGIDIPDLAYLGDVKITSGSYSGTTDRFVATLAASTDIGRVRGGARFDLSRPTMEYAADVGLADFNLAPVVDDPTIASNFTGRILVAGHGTSLATLDAHVRVASQASRVAGRDYRQLYADATISGGGVVDIDTLLIGWGSASTSAAAPVQLDRLPARLSQPLGSFLASGLTLTATDRSVFAASGELLSAGGRLDLRDAGNPIYDLDVHARNLDVAKLTLDEANRSALSFTTSIRGSGRTPDEIAGTTHLSVLRSSYAGNEVPPFNADASLSVDAAGTRILKLQSDIADATVSGQWRFESILPAVEEGINQLVNYVSRKAQYEPEEIFNIARQQFEPINAEYTVDIKDLAPLAPFLGTADIDARGTVAGEIYGTRQTLSITANADLERFVYRSGTNRISLPSSHINLDVRNITPGHIEDLTTATLSVRSDSTIGISGLDLAIPEGIDIGLDEGRFSVHGATAINDMLTVAVDGTVDTRDPDGYRLVLDTLIVDLAKGPRYHNIVPIEAVASAERVKIDTFAMRRDQSEIITLSGALLNGSQLDNVVVRLQQGNVQDMLRSANLASLLSSADVLNGNVGVASVTLNGTLEAPLINAIVTIDSIRYGGSLIGSLNANLHYADRDLNGRLQVTRTLSDTMASRQLAADINIVRLPIDLALASRQSRLPGDEPVKITANTKDLPIVLAAPFVTGLTLLGGSLDLNFELGGTFNDLTYSGAAALNSVQALVEGNNIVYYATARASFDHEKLVISSASIRNDPRELTRSGATVTGSISFDGFSPRNFDLTATIDRLLVLSQATQAVNNKIYGDLVIGTGDRPLHFTGTLDAPSLSGDVTALNGDLTVPYNLNQTNLNTDITYVEYEDWVSMLERPFGPANPFESVDSAAAGEGGLRRETTSLGSAFDSLESRRSTPPPLLERLKMDVRTRIEGLVYVTIELSPIEKLQVVVGDAGEPLYYQSNRGEDPKLTGTVTLRQGSQFTFFGRDFDASGQLRFQGDLTTPTLDITAVYNGRRVVSENGSEDYTVTAHITGTPQEPHLTLSYSIAGESVAATTSDQQQRNAISLLLFGRTADELAGGGLGGAVGSTVIGTVQSTLTGSVLEQALGNVGFIRSFDIDLGGNAIGDVAGARVGLVSQFGEFVVRYKGEVTDLSSGIVSIEFPLAALGDVPLLRRVTAQLQREASSGQTRTTFGSTVATETYRIQLQIRILP